MLSAVELEREREAYRRRHGIQDSRRCAVCGGVIGAARLAWWRKSPHCSDRCRFAALRATQRARTEAKRAAAATVDKPVDNPARSGA